MLILASEKKGKNNVHRWGTGVNKEERERERESQGKLPENCKRGIMSREAV